MSYNRRATDDLDEELELGEVGVAEYVVCLLAFDTYLRYLGEISAPFDDVARRGLVVLKAAERLHQETIFNELNKDLPSDNHRKMLSKAFRYLPTPDGLTQRSFQLRTTLSRGGASTMRAVFQTNRALLAVREAINASMSDDGDAALDKFAAIPITKNPKMRDWIDLAAKTAGSGSYQNAVAVSSQDTSDDASKILDARIQQQGTSATSIRGAEEDAKSKDDLTRVEVDATEAARKAMEVSGQADIPPARSEVVGIATAVAIAAASDPLKDANIPEPLRKLDPEQRAAAITDGRVLVAAGAGAGKSTTLVARIKYLVENKKVNPSRVLACSFNAKAADELKENIAKALGYEVQSTTGVHVGTMHSLFYKFIVGDRQMPGFGTPEEQAMLRAPRLIAPPKKGVNTISPATLSIAIRNTWKSCDPKVLAAHMGVPEDWFEGDPPKAKKVGLVINGWQGNDVPLAQAREEGKTSKALAKAALWYEMYLGIKGDIPGWRPPCGPSKAIDNFNDRHRKGGERLGDLDDMLKIFRDVLRRDPKARKTIQGSIDHILVDEAQDLNLVQHQIFEMMSEHVSEDSKDKSLWMVGDDKQSIYQFRGAKPELFVDLDGKAGWKTRMIQTNYRCEPEIVEAANRLAAFNEDQIPMEARANPQKGRGAASIVVEIPTDNAAGAIATIGRIRKDMDVDGAQPEDYAVLARTNAELNDFETACIINEIPYVRRGGKGFLESPESKAVLGYIDLAAGYDYEKKKSSLIAVLMKPDRGTFLRAEDIEKAVDEAIDDVARSERVDKKFVDPAILLDSRYVRILADRLKQPWRLKMMNSSKDARTGEWMYGKRVDELADNLRGLRANIDDLRRTIEVKNPSTDELLNYTLDNMTSVVSGYDKATKRPFTTTATLREQITNDTAIFSDDDGDDDEDETTPKGEVGEEGQMVLEEKKKEQKGLGAVQFLFALAEPNPNDQKHNTDPSTAQGFVRKIARYSDLADTLRIDPVKFAKAQEKIADPGQRKSKPPAINLSTVHSVKGAEWPNVTVLMPKGVFPPERKPDPDEPPPSEEYLKASMKAERNLAYVALTRAAKNLEILGGKKGLSRFVHEAGLRPGQNVEKRGPEGEPEVRTASTDATDAADAADAADAFYVAETLAMYGDEIPPVYSYHRSVS